MYGGPPPPANAYGNASQQPYMSYGQPPPGPPPPGGPGGGFGYNGANYGQSMPPPPQGPPAGQPYGAASAMSPYGGYGQAYGAPPPASSSAYAPPPPMPSQGYAPGGMRGPPQHGMSPPHQYNDPYSNQRGGGGPPQRGSGPPPPRQANDNGWSGGPQRRERRRSASPPPYGGRGSGGGPPGRGGARGRDDGDRGSGGSRRPPRGERNERAPLPPRDFESAERDGDGFRPHGRFAREGGVMSEREHEHLIEERVQKERPRRTLFVRNVKYGTPSEQIKGLFERIGDLKDFHDLLEKRGMAFVTYYDIRAAMMAKDQLQGYEVGRRSIDVHYSLPRDMDAKKPCGRDSNQGTLALFVEGARGPVTDQEIYARFGPFGDIKSVGPDPFRPQEKLIEFYDSRAMEQAFDALNGQAMAGGHIDLQFTWDPAPTAEPVAAPAPPPQSRSAGLGRASTDAGSFDRPPLRFAGPPVPAYGSGPAAAAAPPATSTNAPVASIDDRLQQALKAQQLLAALGQAGLVPPASTPTPPVHAAAPAPAAAPVPGLPPPPPGFVPPPGGPPLPPPAGVPTHAGAGLPPALAALMPSSATARSPPPPSASNGQQASAGPGNAAAPPQVQALLDLLASQQRQQQNR
ncbi:hypothetical protein OIV83_004693 [Microbotryomycetes sp. JL201]|nr:hypothetical protein OIV83_004693 [Microbotryomycetes sp. JL201]